MIFSSFKWSHDLNLDLSDPASVYVYYRSKRINLLTGFPESYSIENFFSDLEKYKLSHSTERARVFHFYYEVGLLFVGLGHFVSDDVPLVVDIEYRKSKKVRPKNSSLKSFELKSLERPTWSEYKEAFHWVQENLLNGNCYQVNLTFPFDFETTDLLDPREIKDFFMSRSHLGAYAHCTYLGDEMILSNSPECLFHYENKKLLTMPIKGTVICGKNWKSDWKNLSTDEKQEGELSMIVDLLKNDLNRLDRPLAKVLKMRAPLQVPGLLHQYALLSLELQNDISLLRVMKGLFPGGSVTGAPKKRVMDIIGGLERYKRGHYCGSTLLCFEGKKIASINIRTATINPGERLWRYGSGGGITLLSRAVDEFQEMEAKVKSFLTLVKAPGHYMKNR